MKDSDGIFDFERDTKVLDDYNQNDESPFESVISRCQNHLCNLRKQVLSSDFESIETEISFFKTVKQLPLQILIYSSELKKFEDRLPKGDSRKQQKYILNSIEKLNKFFKTNFEFSQYVSKGLVHLDEFYFTRKYFSKFSSLIPTPFFRDPDFSTSHDLLLARHNASFKLLKYMEKRLHSVTNPSFQVLGDSQLQWTSSKVALTELTYALYHGGAINNGNTNIVEIAQALQNTFNFPLGDVYRTYIEIRSRKNGRTKFLDELSNSLLDGMDSLER